MPSPLFRFDRTDGPVPLYYQLARSVERAVDSGSLPHGTRLLSEKDMAAELHISVATVRQAWSYLERRGLITRRRKAGTIVQTARKGDGGPRAIGEQDQAAAGTHPYPKV